MIQVEGIRLEDFVWQLAKAIEEGQDSVCGPMDRNATPREFLVDAWQQGLLEEQDVLAGSRPLERRTAARIVHQFLVSICKEADETDWGEAKNLLDLYDCRTCANHVAQVYAKGIMCGVKENVFGMREVLSAVEADEIIVRAADRDKRLCNAGRASQTHAAKRLTESETEKLLAKEACLQAMSDEDTAAESIVWIDVRSDSAYEQAHLPGALHLPLVKLLENPAVLPTDKNRMLVFYCENGHQSELAAAQAIESGFVKVYYSAIFSEKITRFM